jgi:hypothetical protein
MKRMLSVVGTTKKDLVNLQLKGMLKFVGTTKILDLRITLENITSES